MPTQKKPDFGQVSFLVGVDWREGPPVPIPNTEVKLTIAENTCRVTGRENRECRHEKNSPQSRTVFSMPELIPVRVPALPIPAVAAHISQRPLRFPAKDLFRFGWIGINSCQISRAARADDVGDGDAVDLGEGMHHFQNTDAAAGAEIEDLAAGV